MNSNTKSIQNETAKPSKAWVTFVAGALSVLTLLLLIADFLLRPDAFPITQLKIQGKLTHLNPQEIEAKVMQYKQANFFSVNVNEIRNLVEELPWVREAHVRRQWPDTLAVRVYEHVPVMRINNAGWVSANGVVLNLPDFDAQQPLLYLYGEEKQAKVLLEQGFAWKKQLAKTGLELKKVVLSDSGAWSLTIGYEHTNEKTEFELLLGREQVASRLERFEKVFDRRFRFSQEKLERVDARYPDGVAIETKKPKKVSGIINERVSLANEVDASNYMVPSDTTNKSLSLGF